ncbi:cell division protein FtsQ/DivIB [Microvirga flavescens]|uniref:cell division protein FtsQ/DivIB n=1 Tax=Microvirga flavescens TaxID=2249811 RepID=UPI001FDFCE79|nr:cell division protein FtsQ/DivIB [Microvirga flavescens]
MTAYSAGVAVARVSSFDDYPNHPSRFDRSGPSRPSRGGRRSSVSTPLAKKLPRFLGTSLTLGFFAAVAFVGLWQGGHMDDFIAKYGEPHHAIGRMVGLDLETVTISGISQIRENEVLAAAGLNGKKSLAFLNVNDVRERLEHVPLIKSASVRKLYPNELAITLTEREPFAIWQLNGELFITSTDGTVIDLMQDARFANLPLVVGEMANTRTKEYLAILEAAGPIRGRIRAGTLVSGRRWTLKMDNGLDVRLPETGAMEAVARLVKLDREQKILEKDVLAIDLRMPDRVVVRLTEEAASARAESMKKKLMRGKGVDT